MTDLKISPHTQAYITSLRKIITRSCIPLQSLTMFTLGRYGMDPLLPILSPAIIGKGGRKGDSSPCTIPPHSPSS